MKSIKDIKIAVCFSTQLRTGTLAHKNIKNYLGEMYDSCTFFSHLWNINTRKFYINQGKKQLPERMEVSSDEITYWKNLYPIKSLLVEDYDKIRKEHITKNYHFNPIYYSFYKSLELMDDYVSRTNTKFDLVIKLRPDVIFSPDRKFSKEMLSKYINNSSDTFFVETLTEYQYWMNDVYWVSTPAIMNIAKQFYPEQKENQNNVNHLPEKHHYTLSNHMRKHQINLEGIGSDYACHKLECSEYDTIEEYDKCFDCEKYYFTTEPTKNKH